MRITQKRDGDRIAFYNDRGAEVASLFDAHDHIIFAPCADIAAAILGEDVDYPTAFAAIGLDVQTARAIDAMPSPDRNAE